MPQTDSTSAQHDEGAALPGLDLPALRRWLTAQRLHDGPLRAELIPGGRSNLTYALEAGEHAWVLRRPPLRSVPGMPHDVVREYTVISVLAGTPVPVPPAVALCTDTSVLGAPFFLMQRVDGVVLRSRADIARLVPAERRLVGIEMVDTLADLHAVDPADVGLASFGQPEGFLARQVRRWGQHLDRCRCRTVPGIDVLRVRLAGTVPPSPSPPRTGIVHGDYRLDNLVLDTETLQVAAVLDWEMCTLGDPLADVGLLLAYCGGLAARGAPVAAPVATGPGFPSPAELAARYAERAGLDDEDLAALRWTTALGFFEIAVILEGIHYRHTKGQPLAGPDEGAADKVPALVEAGLAALESYVAERPRRR